MRTIGKLIIVSLIVPMSIRLALAAPAVTETVPAAAPRVFLLEAKELQATKQRLREGDKSLALAMAQLKREAREALGAGPFSVVNKKATPPSGDKHDYMSQAPYFWPNPATSNALPYVRRDGERNPGAYRDSDRRTIGEMADTIETLALAWYFNGDETYAVKAADLTRAWFLAPATRMNPNFNFGQAVPGINTGRAAGLIESRMFTRVVDAIGLLAGSKAWTEADQRGLQEWFSRFLGWMRESPIGRAEAAAKNNHGTYYDIQAVSFALFLGKEELATEILEAARQKRIAAQIEPDGRQPLELSRTKAWSYSVGNLAGLMSLATLGEHRGVDLWNYQTPDGRSIHKALDFLLPFAVEERKWSYQQIGGFSRETLYPLLRRAAVAYPGSKYQTLLSKIPPVEASNRINLLRPRIAAQEQVHE